MKGLCARLAVVLCALALLWPGSVAQAGTYSAAVFGGWHWGHKGGGFDTFKGGAEVEYRTRLAGLPLFELALALPFSYYEAEPNIGGFRDVDVTTYSLIPTAKAYLTAIPALHPYAGFGLGWARTDVGGPFNDTEDSLAVRVIVGAEYVLFPASPFLVFGEYEYTSIDLDEPIDADVGGDAVLFGVRLRF